MRFPLSAALLFSLASVLPLGAQVDSRLYTPLPAGTDVLDVYTRTTGAKPEMITLIDNSWSMCSLYYDKRYHADANSNWHMNFFGYTDGSRQSYYLDGGDSSRLVPVIIGSGSGPYTISLVRGGGRYRDIYSDYEYMVGGRLIKPNGDPVTSGSSAQAWVEQASHVRFAVSSQENSYVYKGVTYSTPNQDWRARRLGGGPTGYTGNAQGLATADEVRVVDIPLPWAVFDPVPNTETRAFSPSPAGMSTAKTNNHPQHTYVFDPVYDASGLQTAKAQYYEIDTAWQDTSQNNIVNASIDVDESSLRKVGLFQYNADYLWWCFFGQDVAVDSGGAYQGGNADAYSGTNAGGYTVKDVREGGAAWGNELPGITRFQAIKKCIIQTYVPNQNAVFWAVRYFADCGAGGTVENGKTYYDSNNTNGNPGERMLIRFLQPTSANNPDGSMSRLQALQPLWNTPLTFAMMNTYAQMACTDNGNSGSLFRAGNTESPIPACRASFVVVLTDGVANDVTACNGSNAVGSGDPYANGATGTTGGNALVAASPASLKPGNSYFNIWTLSGVCAHLPTSSNVTGAPADNDNAKVKIPWAITSRPTGTTRRITTMTVGVSLAGTLADTTSPKKALYATALYGKPTRTNFRLLDNVAPFDPDPAKGNNDKNVNPFYFDAKDPDKLSKTLDTIIDLVKTATNSLGAPATPLVGLNLGKQIYLGTFEVKEKMPWPGDLLMAGIEERNGVVQVIDINGEVADAGVIKAQNAVWSASAMLYADKGWKNRRLFTLKPGSVAAPGAKTLYTFNDSLSTSDFPNTLLGASSDLERRTLLRFMMGASEAAQNDTLHPTAIATSRSDIMGDVVSSTPAIVEFPLSAAPTSGPLADWKSDPANANVADLRFRVIFVGDNQGIFHAFGEYSGTLPGGTAGTTKVVGAVDELWGFIPPDFLGGFKLLRSGDKHRYTVDGSPSVYVLEKGTPNGKVDGTDVVRVMFGLRKGGRSYYTFSFTGNDPKSPVVAWMLRPDESADATIKTMGYSSSTPTLARVLDGASLVRDVFLVGGGLSTDTVDTNFVATYGNGTKLGRSVLALNVGDGSVVRKWDFASAYPAMRGVTSAPAPIQILSGGGFSQRAYFSDHGGAVWALGAKAVTGSRSDTSDIQQWSLRKIYTPSLSGSSMSTPPGVFNLPWGYPVTRTTDPKARVSTVGVVFASGDRNDSMDYDSINPFGNNGAGYNRLVCLMDRQDSASITGSGGAVDANGFTDADLEDLTTVSTKTDLKITPTSDTYYLKSKYGYYLSFDAGSLHAKTGTDKGGSNYYYEKNISRCLVLDGVLYFSTFTPADNPGACQGAGTTKTFRMANVLAPVYGSGDLAAQAFGTDPDSGYLFTSTNVAGELGALGLKTVVQAGEVKKTGADGTDEGSSGEVQIRVAPSNPKSPIPRPRTWRIVR